MPKSSIRNLFQSVTNNYLWSFTNERAQENTHAQIHIICHNSSEHTELGHVDVSLYI